MTHVSVCRHNLSAAVNVASEATTGPRGAPSEVLHGDQCLIAAFTQAVPSSVSTFVWSSAEDCESAECLTGQVDSAAWHYSVILDRRPQVSQIR